MNIHRPEFEQLLQQATSYLSPADLTLIQQAYLFAESAHAGQKRASGEPYICHPVETAIILAEMGLDASTLIAALLHDVVEDTDTSLTRLGQVYGPGVARLVHGVTKLRHLETRISHVAQAKESNELASLGKMLLASADDPRVVLIKLADRLHNMRTLTALSEKRRRRMAQETLTIYAPIAMRLGIWWLKIELEERAIEVLDPEVYAEIGVWQAAWRLQSAHDGTNLTRLLTDHLAQDGVTGYVGLLWPTTADIYQRFLVRGREAFQEMSQTLTFGVIVPEVRDCYTAIATIHALWPPLPGRFDDYIAAPRENFYRSLHTTVVGTEGRAFELKVRTAEMQRFADKGILAFWRDRAGKPGSDKPDIHLHWLHQLAEWREALGNGRDLIHFFMSDLLPEQIHVFTPKGDVIKLPMGATVLDFAYHIHTEVGHACRGAKVNGQRCELHQRLRMGDRAEIIRTSKGEPRIDWLDPTLGYITTSRARAAILRWLRRQPSGQKISLGQVLIDRELQRLGRAGLGYDEVARLLGVESGDELAAGVGAGEIGVYEVATKILTHEYHTKFPEDSATVLHPSEEMAIKGTGTLRTKVCNHCRPARDQPIAGLLTKRRGVTIHRPDCPHILSVPDPCQTIEVTWATTRPRIHAETISISAYDRQGLLLDIAKIAVETQINISGLQVSRNDTTNKVSMIARLEIQELTQLIQVIHRAGLLANVQEVVRL